MRETIIANGGEVLFETKLVDVNLADDQLVNIVVEKNNIKTTMELR